MPAVVPVFQAAFAAVNAFAASSAVAGFLVNTVSSIAMSALATAIRGKPDQRQPGITTNTTTAGGTVPQRLIFGTYATAGQMVCPPMVYQTDGNPNEWLVYVISLADKPVTALGRIFVNGMPYVIDGNPAAAANGNAMGATVQATDQSNLREKIFIRFHDGRQTAADAYLRRVFATYPERPWTADMIGTGVAYAVVTFKGKAQDGDYQGFPSVKFEVDGHALYDPRDGTQNPANEATWKFTRNPAVIAYNILRGINMPGGDRWGVGATSFVLSSVIAAMNVCAEQVPTETGANRARYIAGLEVSVADEPHTALTEIVKAMGGDVADMGGTWLLQAGEPDGPVLSITDDDIIVTDSRSLRPYPGLDETYNAIHASYPDPSQQWEAKEAVPLYNAVYEAKDGGRRLIAEVDFPAVPAPRQVRALMREMLADHRRHRTHVITLPPDALGVAVGQHIAWSSIVNGYNAKLFKIMAMRIDPVSLCVALTLTERDPADYDYDAGSDGVVPTIPSVQPVAPVIAGVTGWNAFAVNAGGRPGIRMVWNPEIRARAVSWMIRRVDNGSEANSGTTSDLTRGENIQTAGLLPATAYTVTGRLVIPGRGTESVTTTVTTLNLGLGWEDLAPEIREDVNALETWMEGTGPYLREFRDIIDDLRDSTTEVDWGNYIAREGIRRDVTAEINEARAEFHEQIDVAVGENGTVAVRIQSLEAEFNSSLARVTEEQLSLAEADRSLAADIREVEASIGDAASASALQALTSRVQNTEAGIAAQSDAITLVGARSDRTYASGLFRVSSEAAPTGAQTRIGLRAEAGTTDTSHSAAMYLEARSDGTSQAGFVASRFFIVHGNATDSLRQVPFYVDGGNVYIDAAFIREASITNAKIGNVIQSNDFVPGENGAGWRILKSGNAEFNNVTIRRQLAIASGTVNIGDFTPVTPNIIPLPGGGTGRGVGAEVNLWNGPGLVQEVRTTPVQMSNWMGARKTYLATASMTGTVSKNANTDGSNVLFGWTADVMPLTRWDGSDPTLTVVLKFWSRMVVSVSNCVVTWRIYEVS